MASPFSPAPLSRFVAGAAIGFTFVTSVLSAQEPRRLADPDSIPLDLAAALASAGGFGAEPQILVGSAPERITSRIYMPNGSRILGSASSGSTVVAIVVMPAASDTVLGELKPEFLKRGWKNPPPPPNFGGGGFRSAPVPVNQGPTTRLTLCSDQEMLTATSARHRGATTSITYRLTSVTGYSPCRLPQLPASVGRSPFPTLYNPASASDTRMNGDCSSTLGGSLGTGTMLRTTMASDAILDHYGRQLVDSGWTALNGQGTIAGRTWTRADSAGAPVEVSISVATSARDAGCREVSLQVRTLRKP